MKQNNQRRKRGVSPARVLVILLSGLLLGLCVYFLNAGLAAGTGKSTPPMPFGMGAGVVLSGSMEPELHVDDLIFVRRAKEYAVGDVVVYQDGRSSVVHRIVAVDGSSVTTKGDANNAADEPVSASDISGKVVGKLPRGGLIVRFLRSPLGVLLVLAAAVLLLELSFRREKSQGDRDIEALRAEIRRLKEPVETAAQDAAQPDTGDDHR